MTVASLWLPIIVSAVVVWIASSIVHMVLTYHKADYRGLPDEGAVADVLRKAGVGPGLYVLPYCSDMKQMNDDAMKKRFQDGPVALVTIRPSGLPRMGTFLGQWFAYCVLVTFVTAYIARLTLVPGAEGMPVLRMTGTVAIAAFALAQIPQSIWMGTPWSNTLRGIADAILYGLLTGLTFMLLWPS